MSISLNGRNSRRRPQKGMKRKHFVKLNGKENRNCFVYKKDRNENYRETDNYNGIIVSLLSINLSTSSKVSVECGMKEEREKRVWEMMWWLRYIAWIMKSCICKERIHWKQRPKNIYDVDKKIKAYTWKWDLFRLKQRTYTSLGVVIVPHVNCTQNDGTKCSFLRNPIEPTDALWFAYVNIYGPSHSTLLRLRIHERYTLLKPTFTQTFILRFNLHVRHN